MSTYVAVVSHHGKPEEVHIFETEAAARQFATQLGREESWENKSGHVEHHEDHVHESSWLEDWGDDDGCGVVVGIGTPA